VKGELHGIVLHPHCAHPKKNPVERVVDKEGDGPLISYRNQLFTNPFINKGFC